MAPLRPPVGPRRACLGSRERCMWRARLGVSSSQGALRTLGLPERTAGRESKERHLGGPRWEQWRGDGRKVV